MEVYLDNSATTRPDSRVIDAMRREMEEGYYNPSSLYRPAMEAEKRLTQCRETIAKSLGARPENVFFTGSGTEADNLAIVGHMSGIRKPSRVLYTAVEHPAVREACLACQRLGHRAEEIPVDHRGVVDLDALASMLDGDVAMLCIMQVNNETGAIQPMEQISRLRDQLCPQAALHVDGVQGYLRLPMDMRKWKVQSYALSAHKIHGPKGIGALVINQGFKVTPIVYGGGQEKGMRSGTENTPGIAGLNTCVSIYPQDAAQRLMALKTRLFEAIIQEVPNAVVNGPDLEDEACAPHILNVSLPPVRSDTMLYALEGSGVYVSSGSACSSHRQKVSSVLKAMGVQANRAESALRFSLSIYNTEEEMDYAAKQVGMHYRMLSKYTRR